MEQLDRFIRNYKKKEGKLKNYLYKEECIKQQCLTQQWSMFTQLWWCNHELIFLILESVIYGNRNSREWLRGMRLAKCLSNLNSKYWPKLKKKKKTREIMVLKHNRKTQKKQLN